MRSSRLAAAGHPGGNCGVSGHLSRISTARAPSFKTSAVASGGQLYLDADGQPADGSADVLRRSRKLRLDRFSALTKVLPAFVVDWDGGARANEAAQLYG